MNVEMPFKNKIQQKQNRALQKTTEGKLKTFAQYWIFKAS